MIEKIFGKKKSIQRTLIRDFTISLVIIIILMIVCFYFLINNAVSNTLIEIRLGNGQEGSEVLAIIQRSLILAIVFVILIGVILMQITAKKMLQPIQQINEATKEVSAGNFNIELETKRKDEIGELTTNFNKMVTDLKSIECLQKDFIDNVSHEFKTPITSIQGFAKLLDEENLSQEERKEYASIIVEESERLFRLSNNVLKLSKLQNQERITKKEKFSIGEQLRKVISVLEPKWRTKNIKMCVELIETEFYGDEELIYQVWLNLLDNAIKFSKENSKINVKMKINQNSISIIIQDYGIGMDQTEQEKIFEKFYQADKSHSEEGSGLGLAIVKRILELSNGSIKVESKKGEGTSCYVELPLLEEKNKIKIS